MKLIEQGKPLPEKNRFLLVSLVSLVSLVCLVHLVYLVYVVSKALMQAGILDQNPHVSPTEIRRALFMQLYGHEFDAESRARSSPPSSLQAIPLSGNRSSPRPLFHQPDGPNRPSYPAFLSLQYSLSLHSLTI